MPKDINKDKSINRAKTITELVICAAFLITSGVFIKSSLGDTRTVPQSRFADMNKDQSIVITDPNDTPDPNNIVFVSAQFPTKAKFHGELILVNNDHQYFATEDEDLVSISEMNDEAGRNTFAAFDYTYKIIRGVYQPMADMIDDFYDIYQNDTLIIYGSYRTNSFQKELYDQFTAAHSDDDDAPIVAKPGYSEHETGYAFDFSESVNYDYQGDGDFKWLNDNCYKYGFIIRYPENKESITEFRYEPWHFRYVGVAHATYMAKNDLCLEEYMDLLRTQHSYDGEHLQITDDSGANYEVYFVASDDGADTTYVPVPTGYKYDISGNNVDGFIVTVHKDEQVPFGQENPDADNAVSDEDVPDETSAEENTTESDQ